MGRYDTRRIGIEEGHNARCQNCKKPFYRTPGVLARAKLHFCTKECYSEWQMSNGLMVKKEVI